MTTTSHADEYGHADFDRSDFRQVHDAVEHETMVQRLVGAIVDAATRGWGPRDLTHVLGKDVGGFAFRAAPRVPANVAATALRASWLRCPSSSLSRLTLGRLHSLYESVVSLGRLNDAELLANAGGSKGGPANANETQAQRKARLKVKALLRKAESTEFEEEADTLVAKAQQLRQRYRLTEAMEEEQSEVVARRVYITAPWVKHQFSLLGVVARANGCAALLLDGRGIAVVFGTAADTDHACDLFESLNRQCAWFMDRGPHYAAARRNRETSAYRRSFRLAYAARVSELLRAANAASQSAEPGAGDAEETSAAHSAYDITSRALPVLARRYTAAEECLSRTFPHVTAMSLSATSHGGMVDGVDAAAKSRLGGDGYGVFGRRQIAS